VDEVKALGLHLEVCPTSNVHTGAAASLATHPITPLWQAGVSLSFHTDNTLMSCISLAGEAQALLDHTPLTALTCCRCSARRRRHRSCPAPARAAARDRIDAWARTHGLVPS
jgi:adenosine deaminase